MVSSPTRTVLEMFPTSRHHHHHDPTTTTTDRLAHNNPPVGGDAGEALSFNSNSSPDEPHSLMTERVDNTTTDEVATEEEEEPQQPTAGERTTRTVRFTLPLDDNAPLPRTPRRRRPMFLLGMFVLFHILAAGITWGVVLLVNNQTKEEENGNNNNGPSPSSGNRATTPTSSPMQEEVTLSYPTSRPTRRPNGEMPGAQKKHPNTPLFRNCH